MISLCSCFDLLDFLDNLLQLLSSSSSSSPAPPGRREPRDERREPHQTDLLGRIDARRTAAAPARGERGQEFLHFFLAEKVVGLKRMLVNHVVVMDVGGKEKQAGRYSGISLYFPDPNSQVDTVIQHPTHDTYA